MLNLKIFLKFFNFFFLVLGNVFFLIVEVGIFYLLVKWEVLGMFNGIVMGYFLYKDGVKVYIGGGYFFNIIGF